MGMKELAPGVQVYLCAEVLSGQEKPSKDWWDNCISKAPPGVADPDAFCGWAWYHGPEGTKEHFGANVKGPRTLNYDASFNAYEEDDKHFVKVFAIDDEVFNKNKWAITRESLERNLRSLIGRPLLGPPEAGHGPDPENDEAVKQFEEDHKIGEFISVGSNGVAWGIADIANPNVWTKIKSGEWKWVSPQIKVDPNAIKKTNQGDVVLDFNFSHVAFVTEPAYGGKAGVKGTCEAPNVKLCNFSAALQPFIDAVKQPCLPCELEAQAFPWDECMAKMQEQGYDEEMAKQTCAAIKNRTVKHGMSAGLWKTEEEAYKAIAEKMKTDSLYAYAWDRFLNLYKGAYPNSNESQFSLKHVKEKASTLESRKHMNEDELGKLKTKLAEAESKNKEFEEREKQRLEAEVKEKAGKVADLKVKIGLLKAEEKDGHVEALKAYGAKLLDTLAAEFEAILNKMVQAAQTPKRNAAISYGAGQKQSENPLADFAKELLGE